MDALSKLTAAIPKVAQNVSKRSRQSQAVLQAKRVNGDVVSIVRPNLQVRSPPLTPAVKSLLNKELFKKQLEMTATQPQKVTEHLDSSMESFFSQRDYTLKNFNEYLMVLSHQGKIDEALNAVEKMKLLGMWPSSVSFIYLMRACAKSKDVETAEKLFDRALESKSSEENLGNLYSTLISVHANTGNVDYVETLMLEKKRKGLNLNVVDYTCQMHAMLLAGKPKEAIEVYRVQRNLVKQDEFFLTTALKACAKDSQSELALAIWHDMQMFSPLDSCAPYSEMIMSMAKRPEYTERAVEIWREMRAKGVVPDERTFNAILTACTRLGDLNLTKEVVTDMKLHMVEMDKTRYCLLMQTYATACIRSDEGGRNMCISDSWELLRQYEAAGGKVDAIVLNSLMSVHMKSLRESDVEGLILPLFESYGVKRTLHTYRHLINFYKDMRKPQEVIHLWEVMQKENITPDFYIANAYLETGFKYNQADRVVEALQHLKKIGGTPLYHLMKKLNRQKDLPRRVWVELQEFPHFYAHRVRERFSRTYVPDDVLERAQR